MGNKEKQIKNNSKFLLYTLGPSKRINEMDTKELRLLSGKAFMMKACSEQFDYKDGIDYWNLVEEIKNYFGKSEEIFGWICNAGHKGNQFAYPVELSEFGIKRPPQSWCYTKVTSNAKTVEDFELEQRHKLSDVISERWGFRVNM